MHCFSKKYCFTCSMILFGKMRLYVAMYMSIACCISESEVCAMGLLWDIALGALIKVSLRSLKISCSVVCMLHLSWMDWICSALPCLWNDFKCQQIVNGLAYIFILWIPGICLKERHALIKKIHLYNLSNNHWCLQYCYR